MVRSARSQSAGCGSVLSNPALDCKSRAPKSATDNVDIHTVAGTGRNRLKCRHLSIPHRKLAASIGCEVDNDGEHGPEAKFSRPIPRGKWAGKNSCHDRRNAGVGFFLESCGGCFLPHE